jgi:CRISPR system Cascade subunit CasD
MTDYLLLRLDGPLQAWGGVALDTRRPTLPFPTRSGLAGLLASAIGWRYRDGEKTTALHDGLRFAVRQDRAPVRIDDFQSVDLGRETRSWTRWGVEKRGGAFATETHLLDKEYLADGSFLVAMTLRESAPVGLDEIEEALKYPARPLFLGRKGCPPALPILVGRISASSPYDALRYPNFPDMPDPPPLTCWYEPGDGPDPASQLQMIRVSDRRDFLADRFSGERWLIQGEVEPAVQREGGTT